MTQVEVESQAPREGILSVTPGRKTFLRSVLFGVFISLSAALWGCSGASAPQPGAEGKNALLNSGSAEEQEGASAPISVEIEELVNDGRVLHAAIKLSSHASIPVQGIALRLSGFGAGQKIREVVKSLNDCAVGDFSQSLEQLSAGQIVHAYLPLAVTDLSSYSLELLWGGEAQQVLASAQVPGAAASSALSEKTSTGTISTASSGKPPPPEIGSQRETNVQGSLVFGNVSFETPACGKLEGRNLLICLSDIKVMAEAVNLGTKEIQGAEVGLSLQQGKVSDGAVADSSSEARIQMRPLKLAPGARRALRLVVPRSMYDAAWEAALRSQSGSSRSEQTLTPKLQVHKIDHAP